MKLQDLKLKELRKYRNVDLSVKANFDAFFEDFKKELDNVLEKFKGKLECVELKKDDKHFSISGYLKNNVTNRFVYFETLDVRTKRFEFPGIYVRSSGEKAEHCFCSIEDLVITALKLTVEDPFIRGLWLLDISNNGSVIKK